MDFVPKRNFVKLCTQKHWLFTWTTYWIVWCGVVCEHQLTQKTKNWYQYIMKCLFFYYYYFFFFYAFWYIYYFFCGDVVFGILFLCNFFFKFSIVVASYSGVHLLWLNVTFFSSLLLFNIFFYSALYPFMWWNHTSWIDW